MFFIQLELQIWNRDSRFYSSYMIFWRVTTLLHRLSTHFPLFQFFVWIGGRMANACSSSLSVENSSWGSIPMLLFVVKHASTNVKLKIKSNWIFVIALPIFLIRFEFIQITLVWVCYFKSLSRVKSIQDEMARFIKGNELYLTQDELFSFPSFKRVRYHIDSICE